MRLAGRVALVTGAGVGVGRGIALELARQGASLVVNYNTSRREAENTVGEIEKAGGKAIALQADVSQQSGVEGMVQDALRCFGRLDILVNNAGISLMKPLFEMTEELWDRVIDTNLKGAFLCAKYASMVMVEGRIKGRIINVGSCHGHKTLPGFTAYAASKGGMNMLTVQLAMELAPHEITVNQVSPGVIEVERYFKEPGYEREVFDRMIPSGTVGFPEDVGKLVAFLASDEAYYITGQVICIDGGLTSKLALTSSRV